MVTAAIDPLKALLQVHRSIRSALDTLDEVAGAAEQGRCDPLKVSALVDFFTGPLRWHDMDEQESLLPRLAARVDPRRDAGLAYALATVRTEHEAMESRVDEVIEHLRDVASQVVLPNAELLRATARDVRALVEPHLVREEHDLFPRARELLSVAELDAIHTEMTARRLRRQADPC